MIFQTFVKLPIFLVIIPEKEGNKLGRCHCMNVDPHHTLLTILTVENRNPVNQFVLMSQMKSCLKGWSKTHQDF